ncbi:MAG: glycosyltransferase family 4 protein [Erysipelotrichaceae bacterium]|nr:glycosyltransferase family 4 protein [Erysipelotrichaceae bacterium]
MKKVLFITPKLPNIANEAFQLASNPVGGWIDSMLENLAKKEDIELSVLSLFSNDSSLIEHTVQNINCYRLDYRNKDLLASFFNEHTFDVYQVLGIEHVYVSAIIPYLPLDKTLLNITGISRKCADYYFKDIDSINPLLLLNLKLQQNNLYKQSEGETSLLKQAKYVTGRTDFDKQYALSLNPTIKYFKCNEILRSPFYSATKWKYDECEPYRIFISQLSWSIKGGYHALKIIAEVKKKYPSVQVYIAGEDMSKANSLMSKLNANYASYLMATIRKNNLEDNIHFIGFIDALQLIEELHKANVFLSPSVLENSSNSLQEAMLIGTPSVASAVGGIPSLCPEGTALLYEVDDIKQAAQNICSIFEDISLANELSVKGSQHIQILADPEVNAQTMYSILTNDLN